jgi:NADPH2:quinone reductase
MTTTLSPTIRIEKAGGPEEMHLVDLPVGDPGPGEIRIRHHACGLNYIDVYQRSGVYPLPMPLSISPASVVPANEMSKNKSSNGQTKPYCSVPI